MFSVDQHTAGMEPRTLQPLIATYNTPVGYKDTGYANVGLINLLVIISFKQTAAGWTADGQTD